MFPYHHNANVVFNYLSNENGKLKLQMQQIMTQSFVGQNMEMYFPEVAKLLANPDIVIKKMACWFVGRHCIDSNQSLLVFNSLFGFLKQPNPVLRVLALQTLALIPLDNQLEYVIKLFVQCLDDKNPLVRRAAVLSCFRVYRDYLTSREEGHVVVGKFKAMTSDPDALVSFNAIGALKEMIEGQGNEYVISKHIAVQITNSLEKYPSLVKPRAGHFLASYKVVTPEEALDLMNALDSHMKSRTNPSTHSAILNLFLSAVRLHLPHLSSEVIGRFKPSMLNHLNFEVKEIVYALLRYLKDLIGRSRDYFYQDLQLFLCKKNDQACIKHEKLDILVHLFCPENQKQILANIWDTFRLERCRATKLKIIDTLGFIIRMDPNYLLPCTEMLLGFVCRDDIKTSLAILNQLVRFDYRGSMTLRSTVTGLALDWVLRPEVERDLVTMMVIFFGHFDSHKEKSSTADCDTGVLRKLDSADDDNDKDPDKFIEKDVTFESSIPLKEKKNNCNETDHLASADDLNLIIIHKLEDVFKSLQIIDCLQESEDGCISYEIHESDSLLLSALLSATLAHFIRRPAQCQPILVDLLDVCSKVNDPCINNKCSLYRSMLEDGVDTMDSYFREVARLWN